MHALINIFKYIFAAFAGLIGIGFTAQVVAGNWELERPVLEASSVYGKMDDQTWKTYPNEVPVAALAKFSHDQVSKQMSAAKDDAASRKTAAAIFIGYYLESTRARAALCASNGVDISSFVHDFESRHADLHAQAVKLLSDVGEDRIYDALKRPMIERVGYEMLYIHGETMGLKQSCQELVRRADVILPTLSFRNLEASATHALLSTPAPVLAPAPVLTPAAPVAAKSPVVAEVKIARRQPVQTTVAPTPANFRPAIL